MEIIDIKKQFIETFGGSDEELRVFTSPGRVNLIGEHIDYCGGHVFPAALTMKTTIVARKRNDNIIRLKATDLDILVETTTQDMASLKGKLKWGDYQLGVAIELMKAGYDIVGCDLLYDDTTPHGGGLSSSAAIEVSTALMFATFSNEKKGIDSSVDMIEMAKLSQLAEHNFIEVNCGIMDQFASAMGKKDHAIFLNCSNLDFEHIPLELGDACLVLTNTNKKHSLGASKYNERRMECEEGLNALKTVLPGINELAEVSVEDFEAHKDVITNEITRKRIKHVVYECDRVLRSVSALKSGDIATFGQLMNQSHDSLRYDYEVTCDELDLLADEARKLSGVIGSRMTGAGFGGCTVSIVKKDAVPEFKEKLGKIYLETFGHPCDFYISEIGDGGREIK
ncbi:MAG: galactokinase [Clostridia bacterium]|nr:galactokinase [Clostridia bacterium]